MKEVCKILISDDKTYAGIVIPVAISNPLEQLDKIAAQIKDAHIGSGRILFDFLISAGNGEDRFGSVSWDHGFVEGSFERVLIDAENPIRKEISDYLREELEESEMAMLNKSQAVLLKNGSVI